ncbi:ACR3 family arsenite efflux transporter [Campylobacter peloridis]|uniref:ACR3 family arsenite efflux transporter n=1 Tax=Campylobacter peloridis TaxID=488546 RepID=A0ABX6TRI3_9BACT|nr:ACR3 family arsenite efflux transporter [Campylobacter peloridis]AJC84558.1 arsenic resistance membrane transporter [Campylobacter peloridis LMG 23910]QOQ88628.1 ACR3 family arsenite efflux transporter [Campylobacter peloridis]
MLGFIDRFLTLWIFIAMALGLFLGFIFPNIANFWESFNYKQNNVLLMICLILMMYPPLAKVEYKKIFKIFHSFKALILSLFLNWIFGPILMFILAWIFLKNDLDYMQGIIIIGLARCVAMVVVWSDLAKANKEYTAALVGINTIFQILCFAFYVYLFLEFFPSYLGFSFENDLEIKISDILQNVAIYLGLPFLLGILSRVVFIGLKGKEWFDQNFLPKISPITLVTLLFTIIIMCSYRSSDIFNLPLDVFKICIPLFLYFVIMFYSSWFISKKLGLNYKKNTAISFSASGNNFELAIAISIASFGISSLQSFAAIIGPLIEVPVLILLVKWALKFKY